MSQLEDKLLLLKEKLAAVTEGLNLTEEEKRLEELKKTSEAADFWRDPAKASQTMEEITRLEKKIKTVSDLKK